MLRFCTRLSPKQGGPTTILRCKGSWGGLLCHQLLLAEREAPSCGATCTLTVWPVAGAVLQTMDTSPYAGLDNLSAGAGWDS